MVIDMIDCCQCIGFLQWFSVSCFHKNVKSLLLQIHRVVDINKKIQFLVYPLSASNGKILLVFQK